MRRKCEAMQVSFFGVCSLWPLSRVARSLCVGVANAQMRRFLFYLVLALEIIGTAGSKQSVSKTLSGGLCQRPDPLSRRTRPKKRLQIPKRHTRIARLMAEQFVYGARYGRDETFIVRRIGSEHLREFRARDAVNVRIDHSEYDIDCRHIFHKLTQSRRRNIQSRGRNLFRIASDGIWIRIKRKLNCERLAWRWKNVHSDSHAAERY